MPSRIFPSPSGNRSVRFAIRSFGFCRPRNTTVAPSHVKRRAIAASAFYCHFEPKRGALCF